MSAMSAYVVILALLGAAPGETTGWGTGEVAFTAYVDTDEHREIYPSRRYGWLSPIKSIPRRLA